MGNRYFGDATIKSHYVWRHYLSTFTLPSGKLRCYDVLNDKYFYPNPNNIGKDKNLYQVNYKISSEDIRLFFMLTDVNKSLQESNKIHFESLIDYINNDYSRLYKDIPDLIDYCERIKQYLNQDMLKTNQEHLFSLYEDNFIDLYDRLKNGDAAWFNELKIPTNEMVDGFQVARILTLVDFYMTNLINYSEYLFSTTKDLDKIGNPDTEYYKQLIKDYIQLIVNDIRTKMPNISIDKMFPVFYFLCFIKTQLTRTKKAINEQNRMWEIKATRYDGANVNVRAVTLLMIHYQYIASAQRHLQWGHKIFILNNNTRIPFIATDQPVIKTTIGYDSTRNNDTWFYYPLSPTKALLLSNMLPEQHEEDLQEIDVKKYNSMIKEFAEQFIFLPSEAPIENFF